MARKFCTLEELFKSGRLRLDDYVEYVPAPGSYITNPEENRRESETIETDKTAKWILYNYNNEERTFDIVTKDGVNKITLCGSLGFAHAEKVLHGICREDYSIPEKNIFARSITIEDIKKKVGFISIQNHERCTISNKVSTIKGSRIEIQIDEFARFYECLVSVIRKEEKNGNYHKTPKDDNPILVVNTSYNYRHGENILVPYWLASPYINCYLSHADFYVHYANLGNIDAYRLFGTDGIYSAPSLGVRPLVSLSSRLFVDITDENRDGSSPNKPWKVIFASV